MRVGEFIRKYRNLWFALFVLTACIQMVACSTAWTSEASNIITMLVPAIEAALGILAAFGLGIPTAALTDVQTWAAQAQTDLAMVKSLIDQFNTAEAAAQPGILTEIQTLLGVVSSNLTKLLPELHVTDPNTSAKIAAIFAAVADEVTALLGLVPVIQGAVTDHDEVKALAAKLQSAKQFRSNFNALTEPFGKNYEI